MRDNEQIIREINASMAMEDMPLTNEEKNMMRDYLDGKISFEEIRQRNLAEFSVTHEDGHEIEI